MAAYISFQPTDFFNTKLYSGTGSSNAVTGVGFEPDFVWIKNRTDTSNHRAFDAVRGANKRLTPNTNGAETTTTQELMSFDSNGFTVGTETDVNSSSHTFASWNWKAGTTSGLTGGTITPSSYSINTTSGFGIYKYTGTGSAGTIAHGLGVAPTMMIVKKTNTTGDWYVYHKDMPSGNGYHLRLNATSAEASGTEWNSTNPTSTVFSLGANSNVNASGATFIAYVFAPVKGFSKFGGYTGNGNANGTFIYTGFRPAFVLIKATFGEAWNIWDDKRNTPTGSKNVNYTVLQPSNANAEGTGGAQAIDMLSNGFKTRNSSDEINKSANTYVYAAFAEFPFVSSNSKAGVAR